MLKTRERKLARFEFMTKKIVTIIVLALVLLAIGWGIHRLISLKNAKGESDMAGLITSVNTK